jgi:hypothetical protein
MAELLKMVWGGGSTKKAASDEAAWASGEIISDHAKGSASRMESGIIMQD